MDKLRKIVEISSNVAIIVVALGLGYFAVQRYYSQPVPPPATAEPSLKSGTKLPPVAVDWSKNERNLLLVLSTTCRYCKESNGFYQQLSKLNGENERLNIVAAFPQEPSDAQKYLSESGVIVDQVIKANPSDLMVKGTPTLIIVDREGTVVESWVGKLTPEKEAEVMGRLFGGV